MPMPSNIAIDAKIMPVDAQRFTVSALCAFDRATNPRIIPINANIAPTIGRHSERIPKISEAMPRPLAGTTVVSSFGTSWVNDGGIGGCAYVNMAPQNGQYAAFGAIC